MTTLLPAIQKQIENRAYHNYLTRQQTNEPGDAFSDWLKAVKEVEMAQAKSQALKPKPKAEAEAAAPVAAPLPDSAAPADDLTAITGIGRKFAQDLAAVGITSYSQIASWSAADIERLFPRQAARIIRDQWVEQARKLLER